MTYSNAYAPPSPCDPQSVGTGDRVLTSTGWKDVAELAWDGPGGRRPVLVLVGGQRVPCRRGEPVLIQRLIHIPKTA